MSAFGGFGLCGLLESDLPVEERKEQLIRFAEEGLTPCFYEVLDKQLCLKLSSDEYAEVTLEQVDGSAGEEKVQAWRSVQGISIPYDDWMLLWEMLDAEQVDIFIPNYAHDDLVQKLKLRGYEEFYVGSLDLALKSLTEHSEEFENGDWLRKVFALCQEHRFLFSISQ